VWLTPEQIAAAEIAPWVELPIRLPPDGELAGLHDCDVTAALGVGLTCRPITETVDATWAWLQEEGALEQRDDRPVHGIDPRREDEVLAGYTDGQQR